MSGCNLLDFGKPARQNGKQLPCECLMAENNRLRERITTQKQTIQSYRDESREWREVADHAQVENAKLRGQYEAAIDDYRSEVAKLRELCGYLLPFAKSCGAEHPLMRELGIEVDE